MNAINYDKLFIQLTQQYRQQGTKPRLLLHTCCAPCLTTCLERTVNDYQVTLYFYNPNITEQTEYLARLSALTVFVKDYNTAKGTSVKLIVPPYHPSDFLESAKGYELQKEGGERCLRCFALRLNATAEYSVTNYDCFATTLTLSPHKDAQAVNNAGFEAAKNSGGVYLPTHFAKRDGYLLSLAMCKQYGIYRQNYCGCVYSKHSD